MTELRKDPILNRYVIIAEERAKRPDQFSQEEEEPKPGLCFFCPGNENTTPPEIDRVEKDGEWFIRVFPNKFPATKWHEIIVETPDHNGTLSDLSPEHLLELLEMYKKRQQAILKNPEVEYVLIFKNQGESAGTSLYHTHTQIIGVEIIPPLVQEEIEASKGECPFCKLWKKELKSERRVYEDDNIAAFSPYASRFPFEAWIMPKRHITSLEEMNQDESRSFVQALKKILSVLDQTLNKPPYNFFIHYAPDGEDLHLHLEICPRLSILGGFELSSGIIINVMSPETAAEYYREKIK